MKVTPSFKIKVMILCNTNDCITPFDGWFFVCFRNSWAVFMLGGGHFAGAIFKGAEVRNFVNFNLCIFIKCIKIDIFSCYGKYAMALVYFTFVSGKDWR
jgi:hypothetical protein